MSRRFIVATDLDEPDERWFVVDKHKAEARVGSWAEASALCDTMEKQAKEGAR